MNIAVIFFAALVFDVGMVPVFCVVFSLANRSRCSIQNLQRFRPRYKICKIINHPTISAKTTNSCTCLLRQRTARFHVYCKRCPANLRTMLLTEPFRLGIESNPCFAPLPSTPSPPAPNHPSSTFSRLSPINLCGICFRMVSESEPRSLSLSLFLSCLVFLLRPRLWVFGLHNYIFVIKDFSGSIFCCSFWSLYAYHCLC